MRVQYGKGAVGGRGGRPGEADLTNASVGIPGNTTSTATIAVGATVTGSIDFANDEDWYGVVLAAGQTYTIALNGYSTSPLNDPYLELLSSTGTLLALDDDGGPGLNSLMTVTPSATGTYFLAVFDAFGVNTGQYSLSVTQTGSNPDTIPGNTGTTATIGVGQTATSIIDVGDDEDWFGFSAVAGQTYTISMTGNGGTPIADPLLFLANSAGNYIAADDDSGAGVNAYMTYTATSSGTVYIVAAGSSITDTGGYAVTVGTAGANPDTIAGNAGTNATITLGQTINSAIDVSGDTDWFAITLTAGETYQFDLAATGALGLGDAYIRLYSATGVQLAVDDDSGTLFDSRLVYTATSTGTYYVSAEGLSAANGTYALTAAAGTPPPSAVLTQSIDWGAALSAPGGVVNVYFANSGQVFDGETSLGWNAYEQQQMMAALQTFSQFVNLTFQVTTDQSLAAFTLVIVDSLSHIGEGVLGYFNAPGTLNAGVGVFARDGGGWDENGGGGLERGGYAFLTILHEAGHGLGLAHPHDDGGTSTVMTGVTDSQSPGAYQLNQGVFTVMSYRDGWPDGPVHSYGGAAGWGWQATPMAIDLAVLQARYGATARNAGDTTYTLFATNAAGTHYEAIWDTGGVDAIVAGAVGVGVTIDLRAATLQYETGGGGFVSWTQGVNGGYTIASGVVIENAVGGVGGDTLIGNAVSNTLSGGDGGDALVGGGGDDTLNGGAGNDGVLYDSETAAVFVHLGWAYAAGSAFLGAGAANIGQDTLVSIEEALGGAGNDILIAGATAAGLAGGGGGDWVEGGAGDDFLRGDDGADAVLGGGGRDILYGGYGDDGLIGGGGNDILYGDEGLDWLYGEAGNDMLDGDHGVDILIGGDGDDSLNGGEGNDALIGGAGADLMHGMAGDDWIEGGSGNDHISEASGANTLLGQEGDDVILGGTGNDGMSGGSGNDTMNGGEGDDYITGEDGADTLNGFTGNDALFGGAGANVYDGGEGDDGLIGGGDGETMNGGAGADWLQGWGGADQLTGGAGGDTFAYSTNQDSTATAMDRILDFNRADGDVIRLTEVDANWLVDGDQAFAIVASFSNQAGQMTAAYTAGTNITLLSFDMNGDSVADMAIEVVGNVTSADNFFL